MAAARTLVAAGAVVAAFLSAGSAAQAAQATVNTRVTMSDGVSLAATVTGQAPLSRRPVIVEFSPYGPNSMTTSNGPAFNYLLVQIRGTGNSDGEFDALGPRTQLDVAQTLQWACHQPWSDGRLGLNGFSASAITVYNSLHLKLPCVRTAVLRSGTFELYRDLLWPGGISNFIPGLGVLALIGAPAVEQGFARAERAPLTGFDTAVGLFDAGINGGLAHPTLDQWWRQRGFRGDANHLPILMLDSFFDVEARGAFQAFQALRGDGAHLLVVGGHDGPPAGTDDGDSQIKAWFSHYLLGSRSGVTKQPRVQLFLANGSRERYAAGGFIRYEAENWPVPGTHWESLWLSGARSATGGSLNNGSLVNSRPAPTAHEAYVAIPSIPTMSDVPNTAFFGPHGLNQAANAFPLSTEGNLAEPEGLTFTTPPLTHAVLSAGPAALDVRLSSTAPESALWAVIADVWPDGSSHPLAVGRLSTAYPKIIPGRSLSDRAGDVVQPYGDYSHKSDAPPLESRNYQIEFWPIGNRFGPGHRIRLIILGASAASMPGLPALNTLTLGGPDAARLLLPVVPARQRRRRR